MLAGDFMIVFMIRRNDGCQLAVVPILDQSDMLLPDQSWADHDNIQLLHCATCSSLGAG